MNWVFVHAATHELKFGPRAASEGNATGPWDCTRQDRRLTFDGWEGFCAVREGDFWALYFDRDGDGLRGKTGGATPVVEIGLLRVEMRVKRPVAVELSEEEAAARREREVAEAREQAERAAALKAQEEMLREALMRAQEEVEKKERVNSHGVRLIPGSTEEPSRSLQPPQQQSSSLKQPQSTKGAAFPAKNTNGKGNKTSQASHPASPKPKAANGHSKQGENGSNPNATEESRGVSTPGRRGGGNARNGPRGRSRKPGRGGRWNGTGNGKLGGKGASLAGGRNAADAGADGKAAKGMLGGLGTPPSLPSDEELPPSPEVD